MQCAGWAMTAIGLLLFWGGKTLSEAGVTNLVPLFAAVGGMVLAILGAAVAWFGIIKEMADDDDL